jgi:hypothetical protein
VSIVQINLPNLQYKVDALSDACQLRGGFGSSSISLLLKEEVVYENKNHSGALEKSLLNKSAEQLWKSYRGLAEAFTTKSTEEGGSPLLLAYKKVLMKKSQPSSSDVTMITTFWCVKCWIIKF